MKGSSLRYIREANQPSHYNKAPCVEHRMRKQRCPNQAALIILVLELQVFYSVTNLELAICTQTVETAGTWRARTSLGLPCLAKENGSAPTKQTSQLLPVAFVQPCWCYNGSAILSNQSRRNLDCLYYKPLRPVMLE